MATPDVTEHVVVRHKALSPLEDSLRAWCKYNRNYCAWLNDEVDTVAHPEELDAPYWYNERASVSSFAAAVVSEGGLALEEYAEQKKYQAKDRKRAMKKDSRRGRVDLFLGIEHGRIWSEFIIEAKQCWFRASTWTESDFGDECRCWLKEAADDVALDYRKNEALLGMAFVAPLFRLNDQGVEKKLRALQRVALSKEKVSAQAIAWSFPMIEEMPVYRRSGYPGAFLFLRLVRAAKRRKR